MSSKVKIRELVETFVGDLDRLIRESVWETAQQSLGMTGITARAATAPAPRAPRAAKAGKRAKAARPAAAPVAAAAAAPAPKKAGRRKKGQKRNPADIDRLTERLLAAIAAKPGQRMEHLGKQVGASTAELLIPTTRLIEGKKIRRTGEKRATQYYPAK
jgi:hypothetical protein